MSLRRALTCSLLFLIVLVPTDFSFAQQKDSTAATEAAEQSSETKLPEVPEKSITVDPTTVLPELATKKGTVKFEEATLLEVAKWLQEEMQIPVVFEEQTISFSLEFGPTVTDRLDDAPVYQLLNRLQILGLRWNVSDGVLYFVGEQEALKRMVTMPYNLGDLLDAGYLPDDITHTQFASRSVASRESILTISEKGTPHWSGWETCSSFVIRTPCNNRCRDFLTRCEITDAEHLFMIRPSMRNCVTSSTAECQSIFKKSR